VSTVVATARTSALTREIAAEALGTAGLVATVVGSGIMGERLADGNAALALLGNTLPTGAMLVVLILVLGPVSGAHLNPAVSLVFALRGALDRHRLVLYVAAQLFGGLVGVLLANTMFGLPAVMFSHTVRASPSLWLSEAVATFGLVGTILGTLQTRPQAVSWTVGLYITAGYWFTASTSFANPAVTLARAFTDTFSGIAPRGVPGFVVAEIAGAAAAAVVFGWLLRDGKSP
jgi:glycerol uptake facilitator-like aquaporin